MGKIVKYCSACDEDWAEKFGFCPTCGATLEAYEMKPVETAPAAPAVEEAAIPKAPEPQVLAPVETLPDEPSETAAASSANETLQADEPAFEEPELELEPAEAAPPPAVTPVAVPAAPVFISKAKDADKLPTPAPAAAHYAPDDAYRVTVIQEKDSGRRNLLLLGAFFLVTCTLMGGIVQSMFSKSLDISAINDEIYNASLLDLDPMTVEEEKQKKDKDDAGGGGGGGRQEKTKVNQGDLADQTKNPIRPPDAKIPKLDNPSMVLPPPSTEGNKKFEKKYNVWGDPNSQYSTLSNGDGSGGGMGSGRGTGQGNGVGTGAGNGNGSGFGNGNGNGNGNGRGDGDDGDGPPPASAGITAGIKILAKPKPSYTDAARQNQVQGTVILRVTFLASGGIGSISAVKGLPNGLTDQAIAAARSIRFSPAMRNGSPQTVTKQVEYSFSIY